MENKQQPFPLQRLSFETMRSMMAETKDAAKMGMFLHDDKQSSQIADLLGFPNNSFFCHFFKKRTGLTPQVYRNEDGRK